MDYFLPYQRPPGEGYHSHEQLQPSKVRWWALREFRKEQNTCDLAVIRLQPLPTVSPEESNLRVQNHRLCTHAQSCPTLAAQWIANCSPPGSSIHETFQARIVEWFATFYSRASACRFFTNESPRKSKNTGEWLYLAEVHLKGMISVGPDSCNFPYIEKCKIPSLGISGFN